MSSAVVPEYLKKSLDAQKERLSVAGSSDDTVNMERNAAFFRECEENRDLLNSIEVMVPTRSQGGVSKKLSQMLCLWYGEGCHHNYLDDTMGGFIEVARANMLRHFVENSSAKYLLMLDDDIEPCLRLPLLLARHDLPVVGGCAVTMSLKGGMQLCFSRKDVNGDFRFPTNCRIPAKGLVEVGHMGTGVMMVRRDVAESFTFEGDDIPFQVPESIRRQGARHGQLLMGEDIAFCNQVRKKGFDLHVDLEAHVGHRKSIPLWWPPQMRDPHLEPDNWVLDPTGLVIMSR